jgi:hypothetical protein
MHAYRINDDIPLYLCTVYKIFVQAQTDWKSMVRICLGTVAANDS